MSANPKLAGSSEEMHTSAALMPLERSDAFKEVCMFVGIDIGGTKTAVIAADDPSRILSRGIPDHAGKGATTCIGQDTCLGS